MKAVIAILSVGVGILVLSVVLCSLAVSISYTKMLGGQTWEPL